MRPSELKAQIQQIIDQQKVVDQLQDDSFRLKAKYNAVSEALNTEVPAEEYHNTPLLAKQVKELAEKIDSLKLTQAKTKKTLAKLYEQANAGLIKLLQSQVRRAPKTGEIKFIVVCEQCTYLVNLQWTIKEKPCLVEEDNEVDNTEDLSEFEYEFKLQGETIANFDEW